MFLKFNNTELLESTKYGDVYKLNYEVGRIYINGVQVAEEPNFMFNYNITNLNASMKKALNRERSNVGRSAYSDSVKKILTHCTERTILIKLVEDLNNIMLGTSKDESSWIDVSVYAAKTLNELSNVVFLTPLERSELTNQQVEILKQSGKQIVLITESLRYKLGNSVTTFFNIMEDYNDSFEYDFVDYSKLTTKEKEIFDAKAKVISFLKRHNYNTNAKIFISETIKIDNFGCQTAGLCDGNKIIILREMLTKEDFFSVLLHEFAHFHSGYQDNTREFENILTEIIGKLMSELIEWKDENKSPSLFDWIKEKIKYDR